MQDGESRHEIRLVCEPRVLQQEAVDLAPASRRWFHKPLMLHGSQRNPIISLITTRFGECATPSRTPCILSFGSQRPVEKAFSSSTALICFDFHSSLYGRFSIYQCFYACFSPFLLLQLTWWRFDGHKSKNSPTSSITCHIKHSCCQRRCSWVDKLNIKSTAITHSLRGAMTIIVINNIHILYFTGITHGFDAAWRFN